VKLEGGANVASVIRSIVNSGIPVIGHLGITPQSISMLGGYRVQGRDALSAKEILNDAYALEEAGAWGVILENVTAEVATIVTKRTSLITLSAGGGPYTDGQCLLSHDILGLTFGIKPKFAKTYVNIGKQIRAAYEQYCSDVKKLKYPSEEYITHMKEGEFEKLIKNLEQKENNEA